MRLLSVTLILFLLAALPLRAAPHAAIVMDARDGTVYLAENADTVLHPASLTKMMTLYVAFDALAAGEVAADGRVTVSAGAAGRGGAGIALQAGQAVTLDALIRATAIRSANDAASALAEAVAGTEAAFVTRMNATARRLGLTRTQFRNPHGLTQEGHVSTARDMALLGRALARDHPGHAALYVQREDEIAGQQVRHTNRRFLDAYDGANGIKTGYTAAAGYCLTASARRGDKHLIVTLMGASDSAARALAVAALMDRGFALAPEQVTPGTDRFLALRSAGGFGAGSVLAHGPPSAEDEAEADAAYSSLLDAEEGMVPPGSVGLAAFGG